MHTHTYTVVLLHAKHLQMHTQTFILLCSYKLTLQDAYTDFHTIVQLQANT